MKLFVLLSLAVLSSAGSSTSAAQPLSLNWFEHFITDSLADAALNIVSKNLDFLGLGEVSLPDFKINYNERVIFINVPGDLTATKGKLSHLTDLTREGSVEFSNTKDKKTVNVVLNPSKLQLSYEYEVLRGQRKVALPGTITASVSTRVYLSVGIADDTAGECSFGIERLDLEDITEDSVDVEVTGFATKSFLLPQVKAEVLAQLQNKMSDLQKGLERAAPRLPCNFLIHL